MEFESVLVAADRSSVRDRFAAVRDALARHERVLWAVVVVALVADLALTRYGLAHGLVERNPIARTAFHRFGIVALGALKLGALGVGVGGRIALPERYAPVVPVGLAVPWVLAVCVNAAVVAIAVGIVAP